LLAFAVANVQAQYVVESASFGHGSRCGATALNGASCAGG